MSKHDCSALIKIVSEQVSVMKANLRSEDPKNGYNKHSGLREKATKRIAKLEEALRLARGESV